MLGESSCIKSRKAGLNKIGSKDIAFVFVTIRVVFDPHGMANKGEVGPRHLCDDCSDSGQVLHVVVMEACNGASFCSQRVTRRKMSRMAMARQVKSHQVKGWG